VINDPTFYSEVYVAGNTRRTELYAGESGFEVDGT